MSIVPAALDGQAPSEPVLVRRWQAGDRQAQEALYSRHFPLLAVRIRRLTGEDTLAEDLAQESWLKATRAIGRFKCDSPLWPWLAAIASNTVANHLRRNDTAKEITRLLRSDAVNLRATDDHAERVTLRLLLEEAVDGLSPRLRQAWVAVHVRGLTYPETASWLGIREAAVRKRVQRANETLRHHVSSARERVAALWLLAVGAYEDVRDRWLASPAVGSVLTASVQLGLAGALVAALEAPAAAENGATTGPAAVAAAAPFDPAPVSAPQETAPAGTVARDLSRSQAAEEEPTAGAGMPSGSVLHFDPVPIPGTDLRVATERRPDKQYVEYGVKVRVPGDEPVPVFVAAHEDEPGAEAHQHACDLARDGPLTYCEP